MRLIDADALIEKLGIHEDCNECPYCVGPFCAKGSDAVDMCKAIFDAPTLKISDIYSGQWIPVSERLPEENMWAICQNNAGAMMIGKYDIEFGWMFPAYFDGIVAWMPLPEPFRKRGEA